jgi:hypothetical protein
LTDAIGTRPDLIGMAGGPSPRKPTAATNFDGQLFMQYCACSKREMAAHGKDNLPVSGFYRRKQVA